MLEITRQAIAILILMLLHVSEGFNIKGKIVGIPSEVKQIQDQNFPSPLLNGINFQSRFTIELFNVQEDNVVKAKRGVLNDDYEFDFEGVDEGEYELDVISQDFLLAAEKYKVKVGDHVEISEEAVGPYPGNKTVLATEKQPLNIEFKGYKEYYERQLSSLVEMLQGSPLGFIFANKTYTIMFSVCMLIIATPYVLQWVNPELAKQLQEIQQEGASRQRETGPTKIPAPEETKNIKNSNSNSNTRRRRGH